MLASQLLTLNFLVIILINVIGVWLIAWVYLANRKATVNQLFSLMTLFVILWVIAGYFGNLTNQTQEAIMWYRFKHGAVSVFYIIVYFFAIYFPKKSKKYLILDKIILFSWTIFFFLIIFTNTIFKNIEIKEWGNEVIKGKWANFFYFAATFSTILVFIILIKKYFILSKEEKLKVQYFLVGISLFALTNFISNIIFPVFRDTFRYGYIGDYSTIFPLGFTAYAIVKRQLFGIRVVLVQLLVGLIAVLLLINFFISESVFEYIWKGILFVVFLIFGWLLIESVLREIKRRKELENLTSQLQTTHVKLEAAYKKLQKVDKAKSEFISIASHQLRTPLTAIKGYISMLLEGDYGKMPEKASKPMESVYRSNERLIKLVNDLLSVSRIEAGKMEIKFERAALEDIISSVVEELKIEAKKKNIYLRWEKPEKPLPKILVDREKIRQVFSNVIDNGIRYTEKGGVTINIKYQISNIKIIVSDTGEGLTKEEVSKMFESFSRGLAGTRLFTEGAGLGLYVARKYVELHQGKIWAESPGKGKGSTFYVELPKIRESAR